MRKRENGDTGGRGIRTAEEEIGEMLEDGMGEG